MVDLTLIGTSQKAADNTQNRNWVLFLGLYREMVTLPPISGEDVASSFLSEGGTVPLGWILAVDS